MTVPTLSPGTSVAIYQDNQTSPLFFNPVLQVLNIKKIPVASSGAGGSDRYRVILSDGQAYFQGMLSIQLNALVEKNALSTNCLVVLKKFTCSVVKDRKIVIVLEIDPNQITYLDSKVGSPINVEELLGAKVASGVKEDESIPPHASVPVPSASLKPQAKPGLTHNPYTSKPSTIPARTDTPKSAAAAPALVGSGSGIQFISGLSPYQNKWTIKARVASKSDIKTFTSSKGEGKLFSVNLLDESGEIKATAFGDAVNTLHPLLEVNKVYVITKGQVKLAKRQFSNVQNDYEITFDRDTSITWVREEEGASSHIPCVRFNFIPIQDIAACKKDDMIDVIGVVKEIGELSQIVTKATQKQMNKRDIMLVDTSMASVRLTLWGKQAEDADATRSIGGGRPSDWANEPVLALKGIKVSDYSGRTLSTVSSTMTLMNPDIRESHELRGWYDTVGVSATFRSISVAGSGFSMTDADGKHGGGSMDERKLLIQIKEERLGQNEKADYIECVATIVYVKSDGTISYAACPGSNEAGSGACQKKVVEIGANLYRCEKCQRTYDRCDHRYVLSLNISDMSGQTWVNAFNEAGETIFGKPAAEMLELKESDEPAYQRAVREAMFRTFLFKLRVKQEMYQGEVKARVSIVSVHALDYANENKQLLSALARIVI